MDELKAKGVAREVVPQAMTVIFNRPPNDDEMRAIHDFLRRSPAICPFCKLPTYALPCTACGEPDIPDGF